MSKEDLSIYVEIQFLLGTEIGKTPPEVLVQKLFDESINFDLDPIDLVDTVLHTESEALRMKYGTQMVAYLSTANQNQLA